MHVCYQKINADCPSLANTEEDPVQVLSVNVGTLLVNGSLTFFVGSLTRALSQCCTSIKSALITSVPHCCLDIIIRFLIYSISCELFAPFQDLHFVINPCPSCSFLK